MKNIQRTEPLAPLLHNSGVPPRTVIAYEGLAGMARTAGPGGSGMAGVSFGKQQAPQMYGTPIRFRLEPEAQARNAASSWVDCVGPGARARVTSTVRNSPRRTINPQAPKRF